MNRYLVLFTAALLLSALVARYAENLVSTPPTPRPCLAANEHLEQLQERFDEFKRRHPDADDPRFDYPKITHPGYKCDEHGQFTGEFNDG